MYIFRFFGSLFTCHGISSEHCALCTPQHGRAQCQQAYQQLKHCTGAQTISCILTAKRAMQERGQVSE